MRFTEFKQPISESNDTAEVSSDLNQIQQLVSNDPVKEKHATSYLTKILQKINQLVSAADKKSITSPITQPNTTPTSNTKPAVAEEISNSVLPGIITSINVQMLELSRIPGMEEQIKKLKEYINNLKNQCKIEYQRGIDDAEKSTQKYFSDIDSYIDPLLTKLGPNNTIKGDVKKQLESMFSKAVLRNRQLSKEEVISFLDAANNSHIIDMTKLVKQEEGNVLNFVNKKYVKQFNLFKDSLFGYIPGGTGANMGPGEVALSLLGNPTEKGTIGDLLVGNTMYEIKGNRPGKGGGRMNGKQVQKPTSGMNWIRDFFKETFNKETVYKNEKGKPISMYNWNDLGIKNLNDDVTKLVPNINQRDRILKKFLVGLWSFMILNHKEIDKFQEIISSSVSEGIIDPVKAKYNILTVLYESYRLSDGEGEGKDKQLNIIVLNASTLNFRIIRKASDFSNIQVKGGVNWNDANSSTSPQTHIA